MFAEFAVDPMLLTTWAAVRHYAAIFGVEHGKLISDFPKKWELRVVGMIGHLPEVEKHRIIEGLLQLKNCLLPRHHTWAAEKSWFDNALVEHMARPFAAILTALNSSGRDFVLTDADLGAISPPKCWTVPRSKFVARIGRDMAAAVRPLLQNARKVLFVDPNFRPRNKGFRNALAAFLDAMLDHNKKCLAQDITYVTGDERDAAADFKLSCAGWLPDIIPAGMTLRIVRCRAKELHDRFLLTDRGGLTFGQGLDEAGNKEDIQEVLLTILDRTTVDELWKKYTGQRPTHTHEPDGEVVVTGRKRL